MPVKLTTTIQNIETKVSNSYNKEVIFKFYEYLKNIDTSENYQNGVIKAIIHFSQFIDPLEFNKITKKEEILKFLDSKRKSKEEDPEQKWITTWNDYLWRIKYFYRWFINYLKEDNENIDEWKTPEFINIKKKKTKRLSPYAEGDIWDKNELLSVIKYEYHKRNKAILTLLWDLNARPHEITLLRIKNIRLRDKYGEGEIPHQAKTGSGPILLTISFQYVRDWLNEHPYRNEQNARLLCNINNGSPIRPDSICDLMKNLRKRIIKLLENEEITDHEEKEKLKYLINTKKWNPYCIRHSAITSDSDYLPEYALKKKVRWSMNSKQGSRYIKNRMGNDLKEKILEQNGISVGVKQNKYSIVDCPRCQHVNQLENKYCSKCSYPLKPEAYDELKEKEENEIKRMKQQINEMNQKFEHIFMIIQKDPKLSLVKPAILLDEVNK